MSEKRDYNNSVINHEHRLANWNSEKVVERRLRNLVAQRRHRARETAEQAAARRYRNLAAQRRRLLEETVEQAEERRLRDLAAKRQRLTVESEKQTEERRARNLAAQRRKRQREKLQRGVDVVEAVIDCDETSVDEQYNCQKQNIICLDDREADNPSNIISSDSEKELESTELNANDSETSQAMISRQRSSRDSSDNQENSFSSAESSTTVSELRHIETECSYETPRTHNSVVTIRSSIDDSCLSTDGESSKFHKFEAFGEFLASSLMDINEKDALRLIEKFTIEIVRFLMAEVKPANNEQLLNTKR